MYGGCISQKNFKLFGMGLIIFSTLACNLAANIPTKQPAIKATDKPPEEEVFVFPTKNLSTSIPTYTIEVIDIEIPTDQPPAAKPIKKTATKQAPTRTAPPPTITQAVIRQATLAEQPTTESISSGDNTVTAATGNLFVRRGPGTIYNIVGGFSKGVTTKAIGRMKRTLAGD